MSFFYFKMCEYDELDLVNSNRWRSFPFYKHSMTPNLLRQDGFTINGCFSHLEEEG